MKKIYQILKTPFYTHDLVGLDKAFDFAKKTNTKLFSMLQVLMNYGVDMNCIKKQIGIKIKLKICPLIPVLIKVFYQRAAKAQRQQKNYGLELTTNTILLLQKRSQKY